MQTKIHKRLADAIGVAKLRAIGIEKNTFEYNPIQDVDLRDFPDAALENFRRLVEPHKAIIGAKTLLKDLEMWAKAGHSAGGVRARNVGSMCSLLIEYLKPIQGKRIFQKDKRDPDAWLCYYVAEIEHKLGYQDHGRWVPPECIMEIIWEEFGGRRKEDIHFEQSECTGKTPEQMLGRKGFFVETEDMRERYLKEVQRWRKLLPEIGKQFWAAGLGVPNLDGNSGDKSNDPVELDRNGQPSRVVIDLFRETEERDRYGDRVPSIDRYFWRNAKSRRGKKKASKRGLNNDLEDMSEEELELEDEDILVSEELDPESDENPDRIIEIPVHPKLACFHLSKHLRMQIHVNNLKEYVYDRGLASKLVLPKESRGLVELLLENKSDFKDIVAGKSGGTIILCAGPPGTGKTLTAEVYAEAVGRPLYSVQASQLGINAEQLEESLMQVLARGKRWNAVMLLDEADVYVHHRGDDLHQNAIVGVFLRVLEYHASVLFLTTNRADLVDDAISSRCTAKLEYKVPTPEDQAKIWQILAANSGIPLAESEIQKIVKKHELSGRDVKNLLKLAALFAKGEPITAETIAYVKNFKPD